jgi:hypothetical protein
LTTEKDLIKILTEAGVEKEKAEKLSLIAAELDRFQPLYPGEVPMIAEAIVDKWLTRKRKKFAEKYKPVLLDLAIGLAGSGIYDLLKFLYEASGGGPQAGAIDSPEEIMEQFERKLPPTLYALAEKAAPLSPATGFALLTPPFEEMTRPYLANVTMKRIKFIKTWSGRTHDELWSAIEKYGHEMIKQIEEP